MRVLILSEYFPPDLGGGSTRAYNVAKGLKANGCEVTVVTAFPHYPDGEIPKKYRLQLLRIEEFEGMNLIRTYVPPLPSTGLLRRILIFFTFMLSSLLAVFPLASSHKKIDLVWAANPNVLSFFPAFLYSKFLRCFLMLNVDDLWPEELYNVGLTDARSILFRLGEILASIAYSHSDMITPISPGYTGVIVQKYHTARSKVAVVRAGVDLKLFNPREVRRDDGKFRILYSGAFSMAYDFGQVLLAAKLLVESEDDSVEFVLQGKGELLGYIKSSVKEMGLTNVRVMDVKLDRRELGALLGAADALILPLREFKAPYSGISSKLYEYQAVGKPIICCADGQPAEYVAQTGSGLVVRPGDPNGILQVVQFLEENPQASRAMGDSGRSYVQKNLSVERIGSELKRQFARLSISC